MPTTGHYYMQQKERLQEEKPRKRKGKKARSQRKDRESVHLARQHEAYFDGGQKAAKGAYGVFISEEMMKDFKRVSKLKVLNNAGDGSVKLYYQSDLEVLAREHDEIVLYTRHGRQFHRQRLQPLGGGAEKGARIRKEVTADCEKAAEHLEAGELAQERHRNGQAVTKVHGC